MQWISDATAATFQQDVVERSAGQLVLVDFWAPWCQPCRVLGPLLEAVVEARGGAVWLARVNVEAEPALGKQHRVQGIPAVKAFRDRRVVDEFVGSRNRRFVDAFLQRLLPSAEETSLKQSDVLLRRGELEAAAAALAPALASPHHRDEALLLQARIQLARRAHAEAEKSLAEIDPQSLMAPRAALLSSRLELARAADGTDLTTQRRAVEQNPDDSDARWQLASSLAAEGQPGDALEQLLELLQRGRTYRNDGARRAMLGIIDELGPDHDLSREYRRRMQVYL